MSKKDDDPNGLRGLAEGGLIVGQLVVPILAGTWADRNWSTDPWGLIAGCAFGFLAAGWGCYRTIRRMNANEQRGGTPPTDS